MRARRAGGIVVGLVAAFLLLVVAVPEYARPARIAPFAVLVYAAFAVRRRLGVGSRPVAVPPHRADREEMPEEQDVRLARLDASLERATESGEHWARVTVPLLRRIATERLRATQGIDVTADPAGARRAMGEDLWAMFAAVPDAAGPAPAPARLRDLVAALERL